MADRLLHPPIGESWTTPYYRGIRITDVKIRDSATGVLATNTAWDDSAHLVAKNANTGMYHFDIPAWATAGKWSIPWYDRAGASAANTDEYLGKFDICNGVIVDYIDQHKTAGQIETVSS